MLQIKSENPSIQATDRVRKNRVLLLSLSLISDAPPLPVLSLAPPLSLWWSGGSQQRPLLTGGGGGSGGGVRRQLPSGFVPPHGVHLLQLAPEAIATSSLATLGFRGGVRSIACVTPSCSDRRVAAPANRGDFAQRRRRRPSSVRRRRRRIRKCGRAPWCRQQWLCRCGGARRGVDADVVANHQSGGRGRSRFSS